MLSGLETGAPTKMQDTELKMLRAGMRRPEGQQRLDILETMLERPDGDGLDMFQDGAIRQEAKGKNGESGRMMMFLVLFCFLSFSADNHFMSKSGGEGELEKFD